MSLVHWTGFDDNLVTLPGFAWSTVGSLSTSTPTTGRTGNALRCGGTVANAGWRYILAPADEDTTLVMGFAFEASSSLNAGSLCYFLSDTGATYHVALTYDTTGVITARRGNDTGTSLGTTAAGALQLGNVWQYVEVKVTLSDTVGAVVVKVNGVVVLNLTNVDTKNAGTKTTLDAVMLGRQNSNSTFNAFDDLWLLNTKGSTHTDFLGDRRVKTIFPTGAGTQNDFANSAASAGTNNWSMVDETTAPDTSDYVQDNTVGHRDTYTFADLSASAQTVDGVAVSIYAQNTDSGTANLAIDARTNGSVSAGPTFTPAVQQFQVYRRQMETNPVTAVAWTPADVNGAEFGIEIVA